MNDLTQVYEALRRADAAGNVKDARQLAEYIRSQTTFPEAEVKQKEGFFPSLKEGAIGVAQATARGITAPFRDEEDVRAGYAEQQAAAEERNVGFTPFGAIPEAYEKDGLGAAIGTTYKASRDALGRSIPYMAPTIGGAATGARLGALTSPVTGPFGPIVGGLVGGIAGGVTQFAGSNIERRIDEKTPGPLVTPEVYQTAVGQAALDTAATMFTLGTGLVSKVIGRPIAQVSEQQLLKTAERSLSGTLGRGAVRGAASEMPTEVAQQILERKQAGLDLTSEDAYREYGEAAAGAGVLGGLFGGAGNVVTRGQARNTIDTQNQLRDAELDEIQRERNRIDGMARTAQQAQQDELAAQERARQAYEASLRVPLTQQTELDLAPETTIEEVASRRASQTPQGDLFAEPVAAEAVEAPTLDESTIKSFGFKKNSIPYKAMEALNNPAITPAEKTKRFDQIIENNQNKIKTKEQEEAVTSYKQIMDQQLEKEPTDALRTVDTQAVGESADLFGGPDTGVSTGRTGEPVGTGVAGVGTDVGTAEVGTDASPIALTKTLHTPNKNYTAEQLAADETITEPDIEALKKDIANIEETYSELLPLAEKIGSLRKPRLADVAKLNKLTDYLSGYQYFMSRSVGDTYVRPKTKLGELVMLATRLPNKKQLQELKDYVATLETQVLEVPTQTTQPEVGTDASPVALEETPAVPRMTVEQRQQRIAQQRAEEEAARREERQADTASNKAFENEILARQEQAIKETPQEIEEGVSAEVDPDEEAFIEAKDKAGTFIRQTFGGAKNIAPEERVALSDFLAALADIMYYAIKRGVTNKNQVFNEARNALGENGKRVTMEQLNRAYAEASERPITAQPTPPTTPSAQPRELSDDLTGDNLFRDLVSPRVTDARLDLGAAVSKITPKLLSMYQLVDQFGAEMPALQQYSDLNDKMTMTQQRLKNKAHTLLTEWGSFSYSNPVMQKKLGKLMLDATRSRIHPDEAIDAEPNAHLTKEDLVKYEELSNTYNSLSPEAKQIYQSARALLQENFNLRRTIYNDMVRGAYAEDLAEATPEEAQKINDRIEKAIQEHELLLNEMRGPYFPLMRFGEFLVIAESDELRELRDELANAEGKDRKRLIEMLRQMEQSDEHYSVYAFEKRSQQAREAARLKQRGMNIRETKSEDYMNNVRASSFGAIDQLEKIFDREIDLDVDPAQMRQLRQAMIDSVLAGLPENSALQRQIKRRNIAGASENMLQSFAETMERDSHYLSRMGFMKPLSKSLIDMRNQSKNDMQLRDIYNNVRARMNLDMRYDNHPILSKLSGISSIYHLGIAPSYLLTNMTQPFMITVPQLSGRYGVVKTSKAVIDAWRDASKAVKGGRDGKFFSLKDTDLSKSFSGGELKMVQTLQDLGKLDIANNMDTEVYTKGMDPKMIKFWNMFNWSSHNIELMNRLSSALAAYRLEKGKGSSEEGAVKAARDAIELTQLDYSDTNAAYFMKQGHMGGLNRIPMQFRKYQQGMIYLLARNFKNGWGGDKEARKAFFYLMGTQLVMAGVRGVPVAAPLLFLMGAFGDDDDKEGDLETQLRNALADSVGPETARVFWKGLPAMMGVDSGSLSMENLFLPFPFMRTNAITDAATGKDAITEFMFNLGGAPVSMTARIGDSVILGSEGDYQKALEKALPKFMSSLVKAERLGDEGITTRSGNVAIEGDEFSAWDQAIKAAGFSPIKESEYYQATYEKERITSAIDNRRNRIIKAIATSRLEGEVDKEALQQAKEFNSEHPTRPITGDSVNRSVAQRRKDKRQRAESGVRFEKRERDIRDVTRFAN